MPHVVNHVPTALLVLMRPEGREMTRNRGPKSCHDPFSSFSSEYNWSDPCSISCSCAMRTCNQLQPFVLDSRSQISKQSEPSALLPIYCLCSEVLAEWIDSALACLVLSLSLLKGSVVALAARVCVAACAGPVEAVWRWLRCSSPRRCGVLNRVVCLLFRRKMTDAKNPVCFFDITADGEKVGRIEMTLRADIVPKTAGSLSRSF